MRLAPLQRRSFLTLLGGAAAAWPLGAGAQQPKMPVIGLLNGVSNEAYADRISAFRQGLQQQGFVEGKNVSIDYRSAAGDYPRLPGLATELVRQQVSVIVAIGATASPMAAKAATSTIPIVFATGADAIQTGLVTSLSRPEANVTGLSFNQTGLVPKRIELARELLPGAGLIAYIENPANGADSNRSEIEAAAQTLARQLVLLEATTVAEIIAAFEALVQQRVAALVLSADAALNAHRDLIIALAARHAIPTIYSNREYVRAGGLMSYGVELSDLYRWAGVYTGRILKGAKPGDLPVMLPTKYELVINNKTAKALGIEVPLSLLIRVDEVIE